MAKFRRSYMRRRRTRKSYGRKLRRGTPRRTRTKSIARRLRRLESAVRETYTLCNFQQQHQNILSDDYVAFPLTNYLQVAPIFGSVPAEYDKEHARHLSVGMDILIDMNTEYDKIQYTMFIVQLKDVATTIFTPSTGALTMVAGTHYSKVGGMFMVNKEFFTIHKVKRFATGNNGVPTNWTTAGVGYVENNPAEQGLRRSHRFYMKQRIGQYVKNTGGSWKTLQANPDPSKNFYLIVFNDNNLLDLQNPTFTANFVHTIRV